jgi:serine/threonine protein kinase
MSKLKIIDKKSETNIKSEKEFLSRLHHPFLVNMHYAFQDYENLYLVIDYLSGGDLRYHICRKKNFSEEQTRKIIILILTYLNNYINRIYYCMYINQFRIYS